MIKQKLLILTIILIGLFSCKKSNSEKQNNKAFDSSQDSICYVNYVNAIENGSTFQYFTVIQVKDINTGKVREICTKGNFLLGALHIENKSTYSVNDQIKIQKLLLKNKRRYFEFKDTVALNNLGIKNYSSEDLKKFEKENNIDSIAKSIKRKWGMAIMEDKNMLLLAHSLFNRGILTGENNCFGGTLTHVDKQMLTERKKRIEELKAKNKRQ